MSNNLIYKDNTKPKSVKEAIENGWKTAKEIYEFAGVCRDTFNEFLSDVRMAMFQEPNSSCRSTPTTEKCITGAHNTKYYHPKVEEAFQLWLKKNAMNAGGQRTEGSIVKQDNQQDLFIGCIVSKGTPEEIRSAAEYLKNVADQKEQLELANKAKQQLQLENQQLQLENQQLVEEKQSLETTLQYDKVKGWHKWSDLKRDWKPHCEKLKKGRYETIFKEAGLEYGKDYEEITYADCQFPTCMVSPTALPKLMSYLGISIQ